VDDFPLITPIIIQTSQTYVVPGSPQQPSLTSGTSVQTQPFLGPSVSLTASQLSMGPSFPLTISQPSIGSMPTGEKPFGRKYFPGGEPQFFGAKPQFPGGKPQFVGGKPHFTGGPSFVGQNLHFGQSPPFGTYTPIGQQPTIGIPARGPSQVGFMQLCGSQIFSGVPFPGMVGNPSN
jgi:hypothetical protein